MQTRTEIANNALAYLSAGTIRDLLDENDAKARSIKAVFDTAAKEVMRSHRWSCCIARVELSRLSDRPLLSGSFGYSFAFQLPVDCLRFLDLNGEPWSNKTGFLDINGNRLLCDTDRAFIRYVRFSPDSSTWDSLMADAIAVKIAMKVARQITTDGVSAEDLEKLYQMRLATAQATDAMEVGSGENRPLQRILESSPLVNAGSENDVTFRRGQLVGINVDTSESRDAPDLDGIFNDGF